jgi:hypothetical protein
MSTLEIVLICIVAAGVAYAVVAQLFKKDTEVENRRRGAAKLASVLSGLGLKKLPEFLVDYSVGDYSGMAKKIVDTAKLFLDGQDAVIKEFEQVFESLLAAKLSTEPGRAYIAAKLTDAAKETDPSVVKDAPVAGTV